MRPNTPEGVLGRIRVKGGGAGLNKPLPIRGERSRAAAARGCGTFEKNPPRNEDASPPLFRDGHAACGAKSLRPSTNYGRACATTAWEQNYAASTRLGNFIVDFISPEARLVAGIDGGHHDRDADGLADLQRTQYLEVG